VAVRPIGEPPLLAQSVNAYRRALSARYSAARRFRRPGEPRLHDDLVEIAGADVLQQHEHRRVAVEVRSS